MIGHRVCAAVVFALSVAVYARAFGLGFVEFDDNIYVFRNQHVAAGLTKESIIYAFTTFDSGNWIPMTWLSYLLDATLFRIRPLAFHGVNVVLARFERRADLCLAESNVRNSLAKFFCGRPVRSPPIAR
jgi:hypothetical protein